MAIPKIFLRPGNNPPAFRLQEMNPQRGSKPMNTDSPFPAPKRRPSIVRAVRASAFLLASATGLLSAGEGPDSSALWPSISDDGRFVAFTTDATNFSEYFLADSNSSGPKTNVYWMDRETRKVYNAQHAGSASYLGSSFRPSISRDGEWVVFQSSNRLIPGNESATNVFVSAVRSRTQPGAPPRLRMISRSPAGEAGNGNSKIAAISGNGRFVVYRSNATNLTHDAVAGGNSFHHFLHDRDFNESGVFDESGPGATRTILMGGPDLLAYEEEFRWPTISFDGERILFFAVGSGGGIAAKWWDKGTILDTVGSPGGLCPEGTITLNTSRFYHNPLPPGDSGTYYRYKTGGGTFGFPDHAYGNVAAAGADLILTSTVAGVDPSDTNGVRDLYLIDRSNSTTTLVSSGVGGVANGSSGITGDFQITADGRFVVFSTNATNMGFEDNNGSLLDIIVIDRETGLRDRVELPSEDGLDPGASLPPTPRVTPPPTPRVGNAANLRKPRARHVVKGQAQGNAEVARVEVSVSGFRGWKSARLGSGGRFNYRTPRLTRKVHIVKVRAFDSSGNRSRTTKARVFGPRK